MPVPSGLLIDIAVLIVREVWRSRRRRTLPATARPSTRSRPPARRLSPIGRLLRLAAIVAILWLVWREITRRREALIAARRAVSAPAPPPLAPPAAPPAPAAPPPPAAPGAPESPEETAPPTANGDIGAAEHPVPAVALPVTPGAPESPEEATPPTANGDIGAAEHSTPAAASDDSEAEAQETRNGELIGWCARCREHHPMQRVTYTTNASGRPIARGVCPVCGAGITRFVAWGQREG
ncbi:MAG: DUF5679 domain-containing protein [Roseiflexus sp.]|uniref:DUF5679 domain-containing protein n=1 Tax=Roseiflexus sp. TaxID=2562120 RepID=UPI0025E193C9|nr:DUF5679 domain-containing protein [Roseiflexus sp.]MCL6540321.1 DUF5679 domain-containing protein [Roseiflexus sp.]